MNNQLSIGEQICLDFNRYLKDLEREGRCLFIPFEIKALTLRNIGRFSEKYIDFRRFNIVFGNIGTGRTTMMKSISSVSGSQIKVKNGQNRGEIDMTLSDGSSLHQDVFDAKNVRCIVLDDAGERLDRERYVEFLHYLRHLDVQVILARGNMNDELNTLINRIFPDCRFIRLN
jgi:hypothetical protein